MTAIGWLRLDPSKVEISEQKKEFYRLWLSMILYKGSKWLWACYGNFMTWGEFDEWKYENFLTWILRSIENKEINIPQNLDENVWEILSTQIDDFHDDTYISEFISGIYRLEFLSDNKQVEKVQKWIKEYYERKLSKLTWKQNPTELTSDEVRKLVDGILWKKAS